MHRPSDQQSHFWEFTLQIHVHTCKRADVHCSKAFNPLFLQNCPKGPFVVGWFNHKQQFNEIPHSCKKNEHAF